MDPDVGEDWFGNPVHADGGRLGDPVPCPWCPASFRRSAAFTAHLAADHGRAAPAAAPVSRRRPPGERLRALRFLSPWFVLPLNALVTAAVYLTWGHDLTLFSLEDPGAVLRTWIVRLSVLPSLMYLSWRVAG
jgi:hypothetical protein